MTKETIPLVDLASEASHTKAQWQTDEVSPGKRITLHFSLELVNDDGKENLVVDSNFEQKPATFLFGDGNMLPSFERALIGLKAGDNESFVIESENAFGSVNEDNVQSFPLYQFPADLVLEKGLMINFNDAANNEQAGVVKEFDATNVWVDFNHPLAGKDILFTASILSVEGES